MRSNHSINLRDLLILIADPSPYLRRLIFQMLRGFGASKIIESHDAEMTLKTLSEHRIDLLLCDLRIPPSGGAHIVRELRKNKDSENRTVPILMMTADTQETTIKRIRDVGANLAIAKPISPTALYDRLTWIAFNPRPFAETATYFGPDRRLKIEGFPDGTGRRATDQVIINDSSGPNMSQNDVDSLFNSVRTGTQ